MANFWKTLPRPFLVLAPMENVTDFVFRETVTGTARPDVFFTEFTNVEGLLSKGRKVLINKFKYSENQRPIVAQIWGIRPESFFKVAKMVLELGFDGIDINMGCPDRAVLKGGSGAALINNRNLAKEIIDATKRGMGDLPLSVKTRIGVKEVVTEEWVTFLLSQKLDILTVHGRTAKQMSEGLADWNEISRASIIRDSISPETLIVGNGDVKSYLEAKEKSEKYKLDGIMVGKGIFANPWVFEKTIKVHPKVEYIEILLKHLELYEKTWGDTKKFDVMKKFFKMYINNFDGAVILRQHLMETKNFGEARQILSSQDS